jgi:hypothetical protein
VGHGRRGRAWWQPRRVAGQGGNAVQTWVARGPSRDARAAVAVANRVAALGGQVASGRRRGVGVASPAQKDERGRQPEEVANGARGVAWRDVVWSGNCTNEDGQRGACGAATEADLSMEWRSRHRKVCGASSEDLGVAGRGGVLVLMWLVRAGFTARR